MAEPKIDDNWSSDDNLSLRPFLVVGIPVLVLVAAIILSCFKGFTALGREGQEDTYDPAANVDEGFVGGANRLLADLLTDTIDVGPVTDRDTLINVLNRKYRALTFALPYKEEGKAVIKASDVRLIAINPERIRKEEDRMFYFNSRLPQLLKKQSLNLHEAFFRIHCKSMRYDAKANVRPITIESVSVIPSMFKVALTKDPWTGVIVGAKNCLFDDAKTIYLTYGSSMLPLPVEDSPTAIHDTREYHAIIDEGVLCDDQLRGIDYYRHYKSFYSGGPARSKAVKIMFNDTRTHRGRKSIVLCCVGRHLMVRSDYPVIAFSSEGERKISAYDYERQKTNDKIPCEDGLKLAVYDASNHKLGEFTIYRHDPTVVMSKLIQTNVGKQRYNISREQTDLYTQQVLRGLSRNISNVYNLDTVALSLDPMLSKIFEKEIMDYLTAIRRDIDAKAKAQTSQVRQQYDMSVTIMDMTTGDILATPYYTTAFDAKDYSDSLKIQTRNPAMSRRYIGSTFKPMVALAAVQANHNLLNLDTHGKYIPDWERKTADFFGHKIQTWCEKSKRHWNGTSFADFLSYSDDVYPVALTAIAMTGQDVSSTLPTGGADNLITMGKHGFLQFKDQGVDRIDSDHKSHVFLTWLRDLYDVNATTDFTTDTVLFKNLYKDIEASRRGSITQEDKIYGLEELGPDVTNLRLDRFYEGGDLRTHLVPWVLGQGDNEWSCIKLAEAWCRMIGKRAVSSSLIHSTEIAGSLADITQNPDWKTVHDAPLTSASVNATWNAFLDRFSEAQNYASTNGTNTLRKMYDAVSLLNQDIGRHLLLFSKTGTPEEYKHSEEFLLRGNNRLQDIGLYSFGLLDSRQYERIRNGKPGHGIVCIVRITRTYECKACRKAQCERCKNFNGLQSTHARNFFSASPSRLRKLYDLTAKYYQ